MAVTPARVVGHGPTPIIAVHGWVGDHRLFEPMFDHIDPERFTCAFLDCRGYGDRRHERGPFTIEGIAADVLSLAEGLHWNTFHLAGHSMGGLAAQRVMADAPDRVRSTVLIAPVPASGARIDAQRRALLLRAIADPDSRRELIDINSGGVRDSRWIDELLRLSLSSAGPRALEEYMAAWTETDFAAEAAGSPIPALVICGGLDPGATASHMKDTVLVWYPNSALEVIDGVGHYPMREAPETLFLLISRCLSER